VLAVRCDARAQEGWWYEGGGIYRHVWLNKANPVHIAPEGVSVTSEVKPDGSAVVSVALDLDFGERQSGIGNGLNTAFNGTISGSIVPLGAARAGRDGLGFRDMHILFQNPRLSIPNASGTFTIPRAALWSVETPNLYRLVVDVNLNGK